MTQQYHRGARRPLPATIVAITLVGVLVGGCAPDAVRSSQATGFNAYLKQLPTSCRRLQIGDQDLTEQISMNDMGNNNYNYFVDQTSRLYYNRISQAMYRQSLVGFFGAGTGNEAAFDCIFRTLPPNRPNAP